MEEIDWGNLPRFIEECRAFRRGNASPEEKWRVKQLQMQAMAKLDSWRPPAPEPVDEAFEARIREATSKAREDDARMRETMMPRVPSLPDFSEEETPTYPPVTTEAFFGLDRNAEAVRFTKPMVLPWYKALWAWFLGLFR